MGIFYRRPLAIGCFLFAVGALIGWLFSVEEQLAAMLLLLFCALLSLFLFCRQKENRLRIFGVFLLAAVLLVSFFYSFLRIDLPARRAEAYEGEREILLVVTSEETVGKSSSDYGVLIRQIDGESVRIRGRLSCGFAADFSPGDQVALVGEIVHSQRVAPKDLAEGILLQLGVEDVSRVAVRRLSEGATWWETLWGEGGVAILSDRVRSSVRSLLCQALGEEVGGLAAGFFSGDRSGISGEVIRDFRRTGTSHLMAVSGLHVSLLLGSVDILLRKLFCPKRGRCFAITLLSVLFLFLTGFSMSACRSVLMLYGVYLGFLFFEETDSLTSLFVSLAVILLIFPYGVTDLGLWMSFLATLGLLTVYPPLEKFLSRPKKKKGLTYPLWLMGRRILLLASMTVIATFFLLPILWYFFGEISLASVFANLLISPVSFVFLLGIPLLLLATPVPFLTALLAIPVRLAGESILRLLRWLSTLPGVTLSLRYPFATPIVLAFGVWFAILLGVRLKRRRMILLPMISAAVAFFLCLGVYSISHGGAVLSYRQDIYRNEYLSVTEGGALSVCDRTSGAWSNYFTLCEIYEESYAGEIRSLVLTHYHAGNTSAYELFLGRYFVRTVYLPIPRSVEEQRDALALFAVAEACGSEVVFYDDAEWIPMSDGVWLGVQRLDGAKEEGVLLTFAGETRRIAYVTPREKAWDTFFENQILLVGAHGVENSDLSWEIPEDAAIKSIYLLADHKLNAPSVSVYRIREENPIRKMDFPLS